MRNANDLTSGNIKKVLITFALPYLLSALICIGAYYYIKHKNQKVRNKIEIN